MKRTVCLLAIILCVGCFVYPSFAEESAVITASPTHFGYLFDDEKISSLNGRPESGLVYYSDRRQSVLQPQIPETVRNETLYGQVMPLWRVSGEP